MVTEFLLNIVFNLVSGMFELFPDISWNVNSSFFDYMSSFLRCAAYILPWHTVKQIVSLVFTLALIRIVIATIKVIWDVLPIV